MPVWLKFGIVTAVVAVPAFLFAPIVFPMAETGGPEPTSGQAANFMVLGAWDAVLLGLGVAVAVFKFGTERSVRAVGMADAARAPSPGVSRDQTSRDHRHQE